MAAIGRYNSLQIVKHTGFGLYLDGGPDGEILLPNRYIPKDVPTEVDDWLNVFVYLDSEDKLIATTEKPRVQVGEFASLKVAEINRVGLFLDWGLPKDLLLPHSEEKRPLQVGDYCVVYVYIDQRTRRITATARLDRHLDKTPARYRVGDAVDLLIVEPTDLGYKAIINGQHWGLIHKNEVFKFLRGGMRERGYIRELRADGKISLSLQPIGSEATDAPRVPRRCSGHRDHAGTQPRLSRRLVRHARAGRGLGRDRWSRARLVHARGRGGLRRRGPDRRPRLGL